MACFLSCHFSKNFDKRPRNSWDRIPIRMFPGTFVKTPRKVAYRNSSNIWPNILSHMGPKWLSQVVENHVFFKFYLVCVKHIGRYSVNQVPRLPSIISPSVGLIGDIFFCSKSNIWTNHDFRRLVTTILGPCGEVYSVIYFRRILTCHLSRSFDKRPRKHSDRNPIRTFPGTFVKMLRKVA